MTWPFSDNEDKRVTMQLSLDLVRVLSLSLNNIIADTICAAVEATIMSRKSIGHCPHTIVLYIKEEVLH